MTPEISRTQVLIVGAGPTGLAAAAFLTQLGIKVRIIDKNANRSDRSKALGVQAGTLECFDKAFGSHLSATMVAAGQPAKAAWIHINCKKPIEVDLQVIPSKYNFILILAQSETERILEECLRSLHVTVERNTELMSIENRESNVTCQIKTPAEQIEMLNSDFVIGCDGAHSATRHLLNIPFVGDAYTGNFILGDVVLNWPWEYNSIHTFVSKKGIIASFPMRGEKSYRLILIPKTPINFDSQEIDLDEFRSITGSLSDNKISVQEATWLTRFRVHHRIAERFQSGRTFLAGDSAHIHSPAGGQGMNTGIQDVFNLSNKLHKVIAGSQPIESLYAYEQERRPVVRQVIRGTDFIFRMALLPETTLSGWARDSILPAIISNSWIQKQMATAMSEVRVARKEISRV